MYILTEYKIYSTNLIGSFLNLTSKNSITIKITIQVKTPFLIGTIMLLNFREYAPKKRVLLICRQKVYKFKS